jgi:hypothetical protein
VSVIEKSSTDKCIDDLAGRVDRFEGDVKERFDKSDRRFDRFEDKVDARFDKVDARLDQQDGKLDTINRTVWCGIVVAVAVKFLFG